VMSVKYDNIKHLPWLPCVLTEITWILSACLYADFLIRRPRLPVGAIKMVGMRQAVSATRGREGTTVESSAVYGKTLGVRQKTQMFYER